MAQSLAETKDMLQVS